MPVMQHYGYVLPSVSLLDEKGRKLEGQRYPHLVAQLNIAAGEQLFAKIFIPSHSPTGLSGDWEKEHDIALWVENSTTLNYIREVARRNIKAFYAMPQDILKEI